MIAATLYTRATQNLNLSVCIGNVLRLTSVGSLADVLYPRGLSTVARLNSFRFRYFAECGVCAKFNFSRIVTFIS